MEELHELRRYHDATPEPAPETIGAARSRLGAHMRGGRRPRARRIRPIWALTLAGAATAALVVAVAVVPGTGKDSPAPHAYPPTATELRLRPVANVQDVADNAALLADGEPEWAAEPTQWGYVKSLGARTRTDGGEWLRGRPAATNTHEQWRRLDDKAFATIEKGRLKVSKGSEFEVSYSYLLALPTDAGQLLARIYETVDAENTRNRASFLRSAQERAEWRGKTPEEAKRLAEESLPDFTSQHRDRWAFQMIAMGMRDAALPPRLRAAMYGAMAKIPGVRYEAKSADLLKRRGITLYHVLDGYLRDEIFVNPKTYAYLGYRTIVVKDHKDGPFGTMKKGEIHNWDALIKAAVVDKAGQRPG
ncbi:CU044_5270 family protein [Nonomuraea glycinis]|uniref:CU044_5270 family protein n=1 Tax=Nonomuraea glycinis TaxID=2047744 RepID=UPI002E0D4FF0|nr:CU044_5270 family protein [Nonomuraea glycinis]